MDSRRRILLLFDNNGNEYVSRIQDGANRCARSAGFPMQAENLFATRTPITEFLQADSLAGIILTAPLSDDRHVLRLIDERGLPCVRIAPMLEPDRGCTVVIRSGARADRHVRESRTARDREP